MSGFRARAAEALVQGVSKIRDTAARNASWSTRIPNSLSVGSPQFSAMQISVSLFVDLDTAPHAMAFEKGSGLHGYEKRKYRIPEEGKEVWKQNRYGEYVLAFPIDRWENYVPPPVVNIAVFPGLISAKEYVMHPGVEADPYIEPAILEHELELAETMADYGLSVFIEEPELIIIE